MIFSKRFACIMVLLCVFVSCATMEYIDRSDKNSDRVDKEITIEQVPVRGFNVVVYMNDEKEIKGELLAVDMNFIWVDRKSAVSKIPVQSVSKVMVELYSASGASEIAGWTVGGTLSTASHGFFFIFSAPIWVLAGTSAAISASAGGKLKVKKKKNMVHLFQFARYPQGWPVAGTRQEAEKSQAGDHQQQDAGPASEDKPLTDGQFCGEKALLVFHRSEHEHRGKCDVFFRGESEALGQGFSPCEECRPPMEPPPVEPRPETACRTDGDCAIHQYNCGQTPCGLEWPSVLNRETHEKLLEQYAVEWCSPMQEAPCFVTTREYLNARAVCVKETCALSYW